jgi:hypothetical protein
MALQTIVLPERKLEPQALTVGGMVIGIASEGFTKTRQRVG